ncbi:MAG TPA: glycosyltransferase family 9 protein [Candidatus Baltobacteraceae bacterium]
MKLAAMGDVFRTTALLPDIVARHERPQVVWLTRGDSRELLRGNPLIHRIVATTDAMSLRAERFDAVYALDSDIEGMAYARGVQTLTYHGFIPGAFATCVGVADGGDPTLFEIGIWDDLKRANRRSYLDLLASSAGVKYSGHRPWIAVDAGEARQAAAATALLPRPLIGVNADASMRWERKQWNAEYVVDFVHRATGDGAGVVLFGGEEAYDQNRSLAKRFPGVLAFESAGNVSRLIAGIAQCDVLLTGDTLAMHLAWGLEVPIVALFGPTSLSEIHLGPRDRKLAATELQCLGCYLKTCAVDPHCMDRLTPELVYGTVREVLAACG